MIRLLLSLYPRAWRERYGEELADLVGDNGATPRVALDVARGAFGQWAVVALDALNGGTTMVIGPAYRHPRSWALLALVLLAPTLLFITLSMLTYQLGLTGLAGLMDPVNSWLDGQRVLDLLLVAAPVVALLFAVAPLVRVELRSNESGREAVLGLRLKGLNVAVGLLALLIGGLLLGHIVFESVLQVGA
jgi:hypothetical protein